MQRKTKNLFRCEVLPLDKHLVRRASSSSTDHRLFVFFVFPVSDAQHSIGHPHSNYFIIRLKENHKTYNYNQIMCEEICRL